MWPQPTTWLVAIYFPNSPRKDTCGQSGENLSSTHCHALRGERRWARGGGSLSSSYVDVVGAVGDGPIPSGGPVSRSEGGVNPRDSPPRQAGDEAIHQYGTEFELHANSASQNFLSSESSEQDSDTRHRCRVKANLAKWLVGKKKYGPSTGAGGTAVT